MDDYFPEEISHNPDCCNLKPIELSANMTLDWKEAKISQHDIAQGKIVVVGYTCRKSCYDCDVCCPV